MFAMPELITDNKTNKWIIANEQLYKKGRIKKTKIVVDKA